MKLHHWLKAPRYLARRFHHWLKARRCIARRFHHWLKARRCLARRFQHWLKARRYLARSFQPRANAFFIPKRTVLKTLAEPHNLYLPIIKKNKGQRFIAQPLGKVIPG